MPQNPILFDDGFTIVFDNNSNHAGLLPHTIIYLLNGNDDVTATSNSWVYVYGGMGNDELIRWSGAAAGSSFFGGDGNDTLIGGKFADKLYGDDGQDTIRGGGGEDFMYGGQSNDLLRGGTGQDNMWGGGGKDRFDFNALSETPTGATNRESSGTSITRSRTSSTLPPSTPRQAWSATRHSPSSAPRPSTT